LKYMWFWSRPNVRPEADVSEGVVVSMLLQLGS